MKTVFTRYPIVAIVLLLLTCVHFEYQTPRGNLLVPGLANGLAVLAIIAVVLLYRIYKAIQQACIAHGIDPSIGRTKYDILIPIAIVAVIIHYRSVGGSLPGERGKAEYHWVFQWSDPELAIPLLAALVGVVFLLRVLHRVRAIAENHGPKN